ncbi:MAG: RNA polymerase subunit sigma-24 [Bacteroidetes bacterium]|nr:MAG: RNA polymerase subunit sigma-24 [Bacteroidota bacterium]
MTTDSLITACIEGDRTAQQKLYVNYCDAMYTLAYRITKNHELANDSLQDAFIEVFKNLKSYDGSGTIGSWIKTIVIRKAVKTIRYEVRYESMEGVSEPMTENYENFTSHLLEKAIQSLPDGARTVFTLVEIEGYKHTEIAKMLHVNEGTSRSQLSYAKKLLRTYLTNEEK